MSPPGVDGWRDSADSGAVSIAYAPGPCKSIIQSISQSAISQPSMRRKEATTHRHIGHACDIPLHLRHFPAKRDGWRRLLHHAPSPSIITRSHAINHSINQSKQSTCQRGQRRFLVRGFWLVRAGSCAAPPSKSRQSHHVAHETTQGALTRHVGGSIAVARRLAKPIPRFLVSQVIKLPLSDVFTGSLD